MIWNFADYLSPFIPEEFRLSGPKKTTPLYPLNAGQSIEHPVNIWIKDESARGTHKNRSFQYWISYYAMQEAKELVVSSSGNSAIAAAFYCEKAGIQLHAWLRVGIAEEIVNQLERMGVRVHQSATPKRDAVRMSKTNDMPLLRASVDPLALEGYKTLAFEIAGALPDAEEIFLPVSSGATLVGMYQGYEILHKKQAISIPRLFAVQTTMVHPIAELFDTKFTPEETHPARAIIDRIALRKQEIMEIITNTNGGGYVISSPEAIHAQELLDQLGNPHGVESALTLAAAQKHRERTPEYKNAKTVLVFTN